jgi:predicted nucleic-acid-binding protein
VIGLDTNVLLRLWLNDDAAQGRRLEALIAEHGQAIGSLLVTDVVLAEALWTLASAYEQDKKAQLLAVRSLLDEPAFCFEDREAVAAAAVLFEQTTCGFADCLIVAKQQRLGCEFTATFDRRMARLPGARVV